MKKIFLFLVVILVGAPIYGQQPIATVSVTGEGVVNVIPDQAVIKVRVENKGNVPSEVKKQNDAVINTVLKFCEKIKIKKEDINTGRINLNKNYDYQKKRYSYVANQSLNILLTDLDNYEKLMQGLLVSGINRIDGVAFKSSEIEKHKTEARIKAVKNAKQKAVTYAKVLGQQVGKAITISENTANRFSYPQAQLKSANLEYDVASGSSETIAIGEMKIRTTVAIVFELK